MLPNDEFKNSGAEFWSTIRYLSQAIGYSKQKRIISYDQDSVINALKKIGMDIKTLESKSVNDESFIDHLVSYSLFRSNILNETVKNNLLSIDQIKDIFNDLKKRKSEYKCPFKWNLQGGKKRHEAFFTCSINMLIELSIGEQECNYDPQQLCVFSDEGQVYQVLSRRLDGAIPDVYNPQIIWEIKEYYNTTSFGSRVADGIYESVLDGLELNLARASGATHCKHLLFVDGYSTWWDKGKPYLCRIIDALNSGLIDEVIFGKEILTRIPEIFGEQHI